VEEHVHLADGPRAEVFFLSEEAQVSRITALSFNIFRALDEHAARATGGIVDSHPFRRGEEGDDKFDDLSGGVKLAAFLSGIVRKLLDQEFVGSPEHVRLGEIRVS